MGGWMLYMYTYMQDLTDGHAAKPRPTKSDVASVDCMYVYNCLVDGLAGHVLVDTRCPEVCMYVCFMLSM